ncbi:N-acetylmuramoyl-L-alanine amidase [Luteimonas sp. A501]
MTGADSGLLYRRVADSVMSTTNNLVRRDVLLETPDEVLHVEAIELAPAITDEDGDEVDGSTEPQAAPHKHPMVKIQPATNRIAHRELRIRVWSEGRPDGHHAGKTVTWSMAPLFVAPVEEGQQEGDPDFRGDWARAAAGHRDRFEAPADFTAEDFTRSSQQQATTVVDDTGHTAIRINLAPIAFNAARISAQLEGEDSAVELIDLEVPGIIVIDPGHGGDRNETSSTANNATSHTSRILEKELTLDFGLRTRTALRTLRVDDNTNLRIHMTRDEDVNLPGASRAHVGRDNGADILLSIHFNGFNGTARGTETLVRRSSDNVNHGEDVALAERVNEAVYQTVLAHDPGALDRGVKDQQLAVLSDTSLGNSANYHPLRAALVEIEFIDNLAVDELLNTRDDHEQVRQDIADAIADALIEDLRRNP